MIPLRTLLLILTATNALVAAAADEPLTVEQLPPAVQRALQASHYGPAAKRAVRREIGGRVVYEIEIERENTRNSHVRIAEDGSYVREQPVLLLGTGEIPTALPAEPEMVRVRLEDLPPRMQETIKSEAKGREIADIEREVSGGRTVYEVEFRDTGADARIHVTEDGGLVREDRRSSHIWSRFLGLQLEDLPPPVQETIRRIAAGREIADIDRKGTKAEPVYRVEIKSPAATQEIRIDRNGRLLHDSRAPAGEQRP